MLPSPTAAETPPSDGTHGLECMTVDLLDVGPIHGSSTPCTFLLTSCADGESLVDAAIVTFITDGLPVFGPIHGSSNSGGAARRELLEEAL